MNRYEIFNHLGRYFASDTVGLVSCMLYVYSMFTYKRVLKVKDFVAQEMLRFYLHIPDVLL